MKQERNKGSVLIFILCVIWLLGVFATRLMDKTVEELRLAPFSKGKEVEYAVETANAFEACQAACYLRITCELDHRGVGWPTGSLEGFLRAIGVVALDSRYRWEIMDRDGSEDGRFSFESLFRHEQDSHQVFAWLHKRSSDGFLDEDDGKPYYDSMMDWQDEDDLERDEGAEDDYYEKWQYRAKDKPIRNFDDFKRIKGFFTDPEDQRAKDDHGLFIDSNGSATKEFSYFRNMFSFYNPGKARWPFTPQLKDFLAQEDDDLREELDDSEASWDSLAGRIDSNLNPGFVARNLDRSRESRLRFYRLDITTRPAGYRLSALLETDSQNNQNGARQPTNNQNGSEKKLPRSEGNRKLGYPWRFVELDLREEL